MKKTWKKLLGIVLMVSLVGVFAGCKKATDPTGGNTSGGNTSGENTGDKKDDTSNSSEPGTVTYTLSADKESVALSLGGENADETAVITLTTNGTPVVEVESKSVAKAVLSGKTITVTAVAAGTTTVVVYLDEDDSKEIEIPVTVTKNTMVLTLKLDEAIAIPGGSVKVLYGNGADKDPSKYVNYVELDATVSADGTTVTVVLDKAKADAWGWFNGLKYTVKDSDGNEIKVSCDDNFEFSADGKNIDVSLFVAATMPVTLTFKDFTATEVKVTYGLDDETQETVDAVVATDGASATFDVSNEYVNGSSYTAILSVVAKNGDDELNIEFQGTNSWFVFDKDKTDQKMEYALKSEWTTILDGEALAGTDSFAQVLTADAFAEKNISTLRVIAANVATSWWANCSYADDWDVDIEMKDNWTEEYKGYFTDITDTDYLAKIAANGLYMAGGYTKVYVLYK